MWHLLDRRPSFRLNLQVPIAKQGRFLHAQSLNYQESHESLIDQRRQAFIPCSIVERDTDSLTFMIDDVKFTVMRGWCRLIANAYTSHRSLLQTNHKSRFDYWLHLVDMQQTCPV